MSQSRVKTVVTLLTCAAFCAVLWRSVPVLAQLSGVGTIEGFDANEYYEAPDNTLLKWRITGAKAQPRDRGQLLLSRMQLQMFGKAGEHKLVVDAPECLYDPAKRTAGSAGKLAVQVDEGRLTLQGEGFLWRQADQTNSTLTISNQVRCMVQRATTNAAGVTAALPMLITARQFEFDSARHQAVFREDVHAEDLEIELRCRVLTASASTDGGAFDALVAETQVSVASKSDERTANADLAVYTRTNETMALSGHVAWNQAAQEGRAERVAIRLLGKEFEADGNVAVKLPPSALGFGGLLLGGTNAVTPATNLTAQVDLFADHLQVSSNLTVIQGAVRIGDGTNQLSCDRVVVRSPGTNAAGQVATAEGHVVVCHGDPDQCLRADHAVYTKSTGDAVFTGQPTWKLSPSEGRADRVTVSSSREILAAGEVAARVTLTAQSNSFLNLLPNAADTNQSSHIIEVFARELRASEQQVSLLGDARVHQSPITGSEPHLKCETLSLSFATNSHHVELMQARDHVRFEQGIIGVTNGLDAHRLLTAGILSAFWNSPTGALSNFVAEQNVMIDAPDTKGQASHATADKLTYTYKIEDGITNQTIELTGHPQLTNTMGRLTGDLIVWDIANDRFYTRSYKISLNPTTNLLGPELAKPVKVKK